MSLSAGSRLGPYEILSPLGAGGMGEVYRARDSRLGRDVAIKVLPASFSADPGRLRRFEQEARAAGVLNHPNITAVHDVGQHEGAPYVVQELLEGETLRAILAGGKLSTRQAIEYAFQIVHGLAAAHEKGIVHRDLKPENLFVTRDGRVKILDFGLAKLTLRENEGPSTNLPTATAGTEPGVVMGTIGYMSPEQVRGRPTDGRSDIFSFGSILYEMLSGRRAFSGDTAADTMSAILREDPVDLSVTNQSVPPGLERIVRHCLEKDPERRFRSAHDLAFDLESLSTASGAAPAASSGRQRAGAPSVRIAAALVAAVALLGAALWLARRGTKSAAVAGSVTRQRLTFHHGNVLYARLTADGQNVVYGASWEGRPTEIYTTHVGSPETRPLGIPGSSLLSVSPSGELAILLKKDNLYGAVGSGTLARVPMSGGAPRAVADAVDAADWAPDGSTLAVLRNLGSKFALEFPQGKTVYSTGALLASPRVSPDGKRVALVEWDGAHYRIDIVDAGGSRKAVAEDFQELDSLAWYPSGREIWFDAVNRRSETGIFAVNLDGAERMVAATTDNEVVHDIGRDGSVLVEREISTREIRGAFAGERQKRNLSWLDQSNVASLSEDGKTLLFSEVAPSGGPGGSVYLRATDGSPAVRLGDGRAFDLSPDGKWALTLQSSGARPRLVLLPTGAGEPKTIGVEGLQIIFAGFVPPDGERIDIVASEPGHGVRAYVMDLADEKPRAVIADVSDGGCVSADGRFFAANGPDRRPMIFAVAGGAPRPIPGLEPGETPIQWSADGEDVYAIRRGEAPLPIYRVHLKTGKKELWKQLMPDDRTGFTRIQEIVMTRDGASYAYSYERVTASDLFLVKGWK
jgi:hypothetical protein